MSVRSARLDRCSRQPPAILSRKRKAEKELVMYNSPGHSSPSSSSMFSSSCEESPSSDMDQSTDENKNPGQVLSSTLTHFRGLATAMGTFNTCRRASPLPEMDWAEQTELWHSMVLKDLVYTRDAKVLQKHPDLEPRMRAILLDWLIEVCEVYRLHRETFHLAVDYVDRYLMCKPNLPRNHLQLLGATALFVASKMEEIYPPKLDQFAFVTDGACTEGQILSQELILIMTLNWNLTPITINCWLSIFLQLAAINNGENLVGPERFSKTMFVQLSQVLDLCLLDIESLKFSYSVIAASAIAHFITMDTAMRVSGLSYSDLIPCIMWMKPFIQVTFETGLDDLKSFNDVSSEDWHNIQTHSACLRLLDNVLEKQRVTANENSPSSVLRELTPPQSNKKKQIKLDA